MAEPTLSLKRADYELAVGYEAGYGNDPTAWTDEQTYNVNRVIDSGLADFYYPTLDGGVHEWSFLKPYREFILADTAQFVDLPDDFNGFVEPVLKVTRADHVHQEIRIGGSVKSLYARRPEETGPPAHAELIISSIPDQTRSARYRLHVFPQADAQYTLGAIISIAMEALTERRPYIYGGPAHHWTVLAACLAAFENLIDGQMQGPHQMKFKARLSASVSQDQKMAPKNLGYNRDLSDMMRYRGREWMTMSGYGTTTIDDQLPE